MRGHYFAQAINTCVAPWWRLWLARIFGKRLVGYDSGYKCVCYRWRGKMYLVDCSLERR